MEMERESTEVSSWATCRLRLPLLVPAAKSGAQGPVGLEGKGGDRRLTPDDALSSAPTPTTLPPKLGPRMSPKADPLASFFFFGSEPFGMKLDFDFLGEADRLARKSRRRQSDN